ncbi:MAG: glyoxalase/bleomycin resistance/extradiol dioxygenase family protein [Candidatus Pacebacteria bacterium]|nr:glyoxalase/bleomycin resistance/extradiol dioxygenase family protein [Candidatus Paceibacterota bacterium]MBP9840391.1 glyoxalase/bleomycin resistance/extradiol dioxygenase family protein [Candidatus Paceibacterota bacterium]
MTSLSLLVFRTEKLEESRRFYEALLGIEFTKEKHGNGPEHYAALLPEGIVLELYPGEPSRVRLGFKIENLEAALERLTKEGLLQHAQIATRDLVVVCVVDDPDGRRVEVV